MADEGVDDGSSGRSARLVDDGIPTDHRWYAIENLKKFPFTIGRKGVIDGFDKDFENDQPPEE